MLCSDCKCSCEIQSYDDCDWECMAQMEDECYEVEEGEYGCDLTEEETNKIALQIEKSHMKYIEDFVDWLEKLGNKVLADSEVE